MKLTLIFLCLDFIQGSTQNLVFTSQSWNFTSSSWINSDAFFKGKDARLTCTSEHFGLKIKRWNETNPLNVTENNNLTYTFKNIPCDKMGSYLCEDNRGQIKTLDMGIHNCPPQLCNKADKTSTIVADDNETKRLTMCAIAFPDISAYALLNGKRLREKRTDDNDRWVWNSKLRRANITYQINVTITNISSEDYGMNTFSIATSKEEKDMLNFSIVIRRPGPPDCPINLTVIEIGVDCVSLSWIPGLDGGSPQTYTVSYTIGYCTEWSIFCTNLSDPSVKVTGLKENTPYNFKVVPNNIKKGKNETCKDLTLLKDVKTVTAGTTTVAEDGTTTVSTSLAERETTLKTTEAPTRHHWTFYGFFALFGYLLIVGSFGVLVAVCIYIKKGRCHSKVYYRGYVNILTTIIANNSRLRKRKVPQPF